LQEIRDLLQPRLPSCLVRVRGLEQRAQRIENLQARGVQVALGFPGLPRILDAGIGKLVGPAQIDLVAGAGMADELRVVGIAL
jgi:hypothetical protein